MVATLRPAVCVINYNGVAHLQPCLGSILERRPAFGELLVVDNGSTDSSPDLIAARYPEFRLLRLDRNDGPGAARNAGFHDLADAEIILFVDNDVILGPGCPEELIRSLVAFPRAVLAMPRIMALEHPHELQLCGAHAHCLGLMAIERTMPASSTAVRPIGSIVTACFLLHRRRWGDRAPFDETFFSQYEDHDLGLRARLAGHEILAVGSAQCLHGGGTPGLSVRGDQPSSATRLQLLVRNRWRILLKNYELRTLALLAPLLLLYEMLQFAWLVRHGQVRAWTRAVATTLSHLPATLKQRRAVQRTRVVGDGRILTDVAIPIRAGVPASRAERHALRVLDAATRAYWRVCRRLI